MRHEQRTNVKERSIAHRRRKERGLVDLCTVKISINLKIAMTNENVYLYQLIEFVAETTEDGKKSIDCVPTKWVEFDSLIGKHFAKFMPPPYDSENKRQLKKMIIDRDDPLDDWPRYHVTIRGGAATYEEAKQSLTVEEFAYTSGYEEPRKKAELTQFLDIAKREEKNSEIMTVPNLQEKPTTSLQKSSSEYSEEKSSESSEEECTSVLQDKMKYSKQRGEMLQEKQFTIAENKTSLTSQSTSVSPTTSSPLSLSKLSDAFNAMRLDREKCIKTTSARDDTFNLCIDDTLTEYNLKLISIKDRISALKRQMDAVIKELQATLDIVLTTCVEQIQTPIETFEAKYKLKLPLNTYEEFIELDNKIREDEECRTSFMLMLSQKFDKEKNITKNITALLKQYMTKDVALLFNAQKKVDGKYVFKDTTFSKCLLRVIGEKSVKISEEDEKNYLKDLGAVLSNIKNWNSPRARPSK